MWNFGDGSTSTYKNPKHKFPEIPGKYIIDLTVSNMIGKCGVTVSSSIFMPEPVIYFIPNTFTPNGDEINNTFQPVFTYGYDPQNYSFYIYNRWGNLIFESHDAKIGWDGTFGEELVQNDTYIWKLEFKEKILSELMRMYKEGNIKTEKDILNNILLEYLKISLQLTYDKRMDELKQLFIDYNDGITQEKYDKFVTTFQYTQLLYEPYDKIYTIVENLLKK
jgi:gliding motility-associated-like protein